MNNNALIAIILVAAVSIAGVSVFLMLDPKDSDAIDRDYYEGKKSTYAVVSDTGEELRGKVVCTVTSEDPDGFDLSVDAWIYKYDGSFKDPVFSRTETCRIGSTFSPSDRIGEKTIDSNFGMRECYMYRQNYERQGHDVEVVTYIPKDGILELEHDITMKDGLSFRCVLASSGLLNGSKAHPDSNPFRYYEVTGQKDMRPISGFVRTEQTEVQDYKTTNEVQKFIWFDDSTGGTLASEICMEYGKLPRFGEYRSKDIAVLNTAWGQRTCYIVQEADRTGTVQTSYIGTMDDLMYRRMTSCFSMNGNLIATEELKMTNLQKDTKVPDDAHGVYEKGRFFTYDITGYGGWEDMPYTSEGTSTITVTAVNETHHFRDITGHMKMTVGSETVDIPVEKITGRCTINSNVLDRDLFIRTQDLETPWGVRTCEVYGDSETGVYICDGIVYRMENTEYSSGYPATLIYDLAETNAF